MAVITKSYPSLSLVSDPGLSAHTPEINALINNAYKSQDRSSYGAQPFLPGRRIHSRDQLASELGGEGMVAVAFAANDDADVNIRIGKGGEVFQVPETEVDVEPKSADIRRSHPVAIACIKPWKGRAIDLWRAAQTNPSGSDFDNRAVEEVAVSTSRSDTDSSPKKLSLDEHIKPATGITTITQDWEVCICASINDPRYRGQGLVTQCIDVLMQELLKRIHGTATAAGPTTISLWATALEGVGNVEYWTRRGFVRQGVAEDAPVGLWGAIRPFRVGTLRKVVVLPVCGEGR
ncbi:hypothetical protein PMZ80_006466 [Knufia obscura]|uniref:N-acetyltransferase domain-containing protein n=2 Tax=Knufia TaxID=430999 RepID=A0AAN8EDZ0_9EURO|nr:hypothetical protein PMZ80_006466 [Knufia obscura]KAK5953384.1 hypothetical protein OHC33_005328 [Knufia fluminis]